MAAFATGVLPNIYEFHLYTGNSAILSRTPSPPVSSAVPGLSPGLSRPTSRTAYAPFTPSNSEQRLPPPYYRGCWHGVSRGFFYGYRQPCGFFPVERVLRPKRLHHPRGVAWSGLPPLPKIPHCCLP